MSETQLSRESNSQGAPSPEEAQPRDVLITVIIATRNRAQSLRSTLEFLLIPANLGSFDWELLVVDNGSSDQTKELCLDFQRRFPRHFRSIVETRAGKSHALNTAIQAASGNLLAFTDDDVTCAPEYLHGIRDFFSSHVADGVQGRVFLDCEGGWPRWLDAGTAAMAGFRDCGEQVTELKGTMYGLNMIVKSDVFRKIGGFLPYLGPGLIGAEDTEFSLRMRHAGMQQMYAPQIVLHHRLSRQRLTRNFFRKRFFQEGRSNCYRDELPVSLLRFSLYVFKECLFREARAVGFRVRNRPDMALAEECEACMQVGSLWQHVCFWVHGTSNAPKAAIR
jgi:glycosyltransferase involved in cell wall biosynthesis